MDAKKLIESGGAVLGIELGSTRIKSVLIGLDFKPLAQGSHEWENQLDEHGLEVKPDFVIADALDLDIPCKTEGIIKGDAKSYTIGAASILAKVYRDKLMEEYDKEYPSYNFAANKGYGTKAHTDAIKEVGQCPIHRKTFIRKFLEEKASDLPSDI